MDYKKIYTTYQRRERMSELIKDIRSALESQLETSKLGDDANWNKDDIEEFLSDFEDSIRPLVESSRVS